MVSEHLAHQLNSYRRHMVEGTGQPAPRPVDVDRLVNEQRSGPLGASPTELPRLLQKPCWTRLVTHRSAPSSSGPPLEVCRKTWSWPTSTPFAPKLHRCSREAIECDRAGRRLSRGVASNLQGRTRIRYLHSSDRVAPKLVQYLRSVLPQRWNIAHPRFGAEVHRRQQRANRSGLRADFPPSVATRQHGCSNNSATVFTPA